jgi:adenylate kinase
MSARYVILLGAPGAGKGTQAANISAATGLVHVSTGDLFRENLKSGTELGNLARGYMDRGQLVPDDVTIRMLLERISRPDTAAGVLLDGFPRTIAQAEALDAALAERGTGVDAVLYIRVPDEELLRRLTSRWLCRKGPEIYNAMSNPPKVEGVCDVDGGELYQRDDDKPEAAKHRLEVFYDETAPLIEFYTRQGKLREVDGTGELEDVGRDLVGALEGAAA